MVIALLCSLALLAAAETIVSPDEIVSLDDLTFDLRVDDAAASPATSHRRLLAAADSLVNGSTSACACLQPPTTPPAGGTVFGYGCHAHDNYTSCGSSKHCKDKWCYVASGSCTVENHLSDKSVPAEVSSDPLVSTATPAAGTTPLHYSYATCGYVDRYTLTKSMKSLSGVTVKTMYLANTGGWKGTKCDETIKSGGIGTKDKCRGGAYRFIELLQAAEGFVVEEVNKFEPVVAAQKPRGKATLGFNPKDFQLCVSAVGMGFLDLCNAAIVLTPERTQIAPFITLFEEPVYLVSKYDVETESFAKKLRSAFAPFEWQLWFLILFLVVVISGLIGSMEHRPGGEFEGRGMVTTTVEATHDGISSLLGGGSKFEPITLGGKFASIGLGFLILLTISAYTANLASYLIVQRSRTTEVQSIVDAVRLRKTMCAHRVDKNGLLLNYPDLPKELLIESPTRTQALKDAVDGTCDLAIAREEELQFQRGLGEACTMQFVGAPLFTLAVGVPVSPRYFMRFQNAVARATTNGLVRQAMKETLPVDACPVRSAVNTNSGMTIDQMAGPLLLSAVFSIFGILCHLASTRLTTGKKDAKGSTEDHNHVNSVRSMLIHIERQQAEILDHLGVGASNAA